MEDNLCFIGVLEEEDDDKYLENMEVLWISDPTMFFIEVENEDLEEVYFWSLLGFRLFATDIKVNGDTKIKDRIYSTADFPIVQISATHETFRDKLGEETSEKIMKDVLMVEDEMFKNYINRTQSN